jgi:hypothetical protein
MGKRRFELLERPSGMRSRWFSSAKKALRAAVRSMPVGVMWEVREHKIESIYVGLMRDEDTKKEYNRRFRRHFGRFF